MSAIIGVFGDALPDDEALRRMRAAAQPRGDDRVEVWRGDGAVLAVARNEWECAAHLAGETLIADGGDVMVAADASIYHRAELVRRLAGAGVVASPDAPAAQLVLSA
jgi:asparagine synthetase B (glutamine-hydrolysing)